MTSTAVPATMSHRASPSRVNRAALLLDRHDPKRFVKLEDQHALSRDTDSLTLCQDLRKSHNSGPSPCPNGRALDATTLRCGRDDQLGFRSSRDGAGAAVVAGE